MLRLLVLAATFALALPSLALAEEPHHPGPGPHPAAVPHPPPHPGGPHPGGPPARGGPRGPGPGGPAHPAFIPHPGGPGGPVGMGPHPGGPGAGQFSYRGHMIERRHLDPFVYPQGWAYRRWAVGAMLPPLFLARDYWYADWAALGLSPPPPGYQWVRYGPDLLLVDVSTGQVVDTAYDVFY